MHIEFIKNHGAYSPGDIAGFDPAIAEILVKEKGVAVIKEWSDAPAPAVVAGGGVPNKTVSTDDEMDDQQVRGRRKK